MANWLVNGGCTLLLSIGNVDEAKVLQGDRFCDRLTNKRI